MLLPTVSVTLGPLWASEINTALGIVDAHSHAPGSGLQIGAAGLNITSDLTLNTNDLTGIRTLRLTDQTSITLAGTDIRAMYSKNGDLYYRSSASQEVQVTNGASLAGISGTITGLTSPAAAAYSSITGTFAFTKDTNKGGKLAISDIALYEFDNASAQPITLKSPAAVVAYSMTLPAAVPTQAGLMAINTAGQLQYGAPDGTQAAPGIAFASDSNTGFYRTGNDVIKVSTGNSLALEIDTNSTYFPNGTVSLPALSFLSDIDTGIYRVSANRMGFVANGVGSVELVDRGFQAVSGSAAIPPYAFSSDDDTGMYLTSTGTLSFATAGIARLSMSTSGEAVSTLRWRGPGGTNAFPGMSFSGDTDTGISSTSANQLEFNTGGTLQAYFDGTRLESAVPLRFTGTGSTGLRWQTFSGSLGSGVTATHTASGTIYGAFGWNSTDGQSIAGSSAGADGSGGIYFSQSGVANQVTVANTIATGTRSYRVTVFYA